MVGSAGNVSARRGAAVRITPTSLPYDRMRRADLVTVDLERHLATGRHRPSRELPLHLAVYRQRPDVAAIVHCHSPHATAWSFLDRPLGPATEEIAYYRIGPIRVAEEAAAGSAELGDATVSALGASQAVLLRGHGTVAVGATLEAAAVVARAVEHQAHVAWLLHARTSDRPTPFANGDGRSSTFPAIRSR